MSYGHAERTLATIRLLEAETRDLLSHREQLTAEQERWLREAADSASWRLSSPGAVMHTPGQVGARLSAGLRRSVRKELHRCVMILG